MPNKQGINEWVSNTQSMQRCTRSLFNRHSK